MAPLDRKLLRELWRLRGQVLAIALVIGCGVATVVLSQGTLASLVATRDTYYERYRFADVFASARRAPETLLARLAALPGVARADSRIVLAAVLQVPGFDEPVRGRLVSLPARGAPRLNAVHLEAGRWPRPDRPDEALLSTAFAEAHGLRPGGTLYANINGVRRALRVVGTAIAPEFIYAVAPGSFVPDDRRYGVVWLGRRMLEAATDLDGAFNDVLLKLQRGASEAAVIERVDDLLAPYGGTGAYGRHDHPSDSFLRSELEQLRALGLTIPPIFLAVSAFLINVVMGRIVDTEREQIGLLKAFGYGGGAIGLHYLKLALAVGALGVLTGWLGGVWLGREMTGLYGEYYRFPFLSYRLEPAVFAVSGLVSLAACAAGALAAVRRAVRLAPAVAMAPPLPPSFRTGYLERIPLLRRMRGPGRIVWRHIVHWPLRSALTVGGVAFALALLISTLFFLDGIEVMLEHEFVRTQHQDVTVALFDERNSAIRHEAMTLPGVLDAEGFRSVPARLHSGHRSERLAVTGLAPDARLSRPLDAGGRPVTPPARGIVLTRHLAQRLGAGLGDRVRLEFLNGRRLTGEVPVVGVVESYVGLAAYMDREALNRLSGDGPVVSGLHLRVDAARQEALFRALGERPLVQGIAVKAAMLQRFRELIDETMLTSILIYVLFAGTIAAGVVYNSARVALSERGRELASLRVLGFTAGEVTAMFLAQFAVLTLAALPAGCLIGRYLAEAMALAFSTDLYRMPFVLQPATYAWASVVILAAAAAAALLVARRLRSMDLVAVLKTRE